MKLNVGSGPSAISGWENFDRSPGIVINRFRVLAALTAALGLVDSSNIQTWDKGVRRADVLRGLPLGAGSADVVYCSHALEHLYLAEAGVALAEFSRVLRPGGILRLALPNVLDYANELVHSDDPVEGTLNFNRNLNMASLEPPNLRSRIRGLFASSAHKWQPTPALTISLARDAGFIDAEQRPFLSSSIEDIRTIEYRKDGFFVEATRPPYSSDLSP